jgi:hypothetical protein
LLDNLIAQRMTPTGCPDGGHPSHRRNRTPGVSARSKAKKAARQRMLDECRRARFWEAEWRSGHEHVKPLWLHAGSRRWVH